MKIIDRIKKENLSKLPAARLQLMHDQFQLILEKFKGGFFKDRAVLSEEEAVDRISDINLTIINLEEEIGTKKKQAMEALRNNNRTLAKNFLMMSKMAERQIEFKKKLVEFYEMHVNYNRIQDNVNLLAEALEIQNEADLSTTSLEVVRDAAPVVAASKKNLIEQYTQSTPAKTLRAELGEQLRDIAKHNPKYAPKAARMAAAILRNQERVEMLQAKERKAKALLAKMNRLREKLAAAQKPQQKRAGRLFARRFARINNSSSISM